MKNSSLIELLELVNTANEVSDLDNLLGNSLTTKEQSILWKAKKEKAFKLTKTQETKKAIKCLTIETLVGLISELTNDLRNLVTDDDIRRIKYFRQQLALELATRY